MAGILRRHRPIAAALAFALVLGGCSTMDADTANMTPAQRELHQRTARFYESTSLGAVSSCVTGIGCDDGFWAGYYMDSRNKRYDTSERRTDALIAAARKDSDDFARTAELAGQVTRENRARLEQIDSQYRAGQINAAAFRREAEAARNDLEKIRTASRKAGEVVRTIESDARQARDTALRQEAARVDAAERRLRQSAMDLELALNRFPVA